MPVREAAKDAAEGRVDGAKYQVPGVGLAWPRPPGAARGVLGH
jgi:hypothetical protein